MANSDRDAEEGEETRRKEKRAEYEKLALSPLVIPTKEERAQEIAERIYNAVQETAKISWHNNLPDELFPHVVEAKLDRDHGASFRVIADTHKRQRIVFLRALQVADERLEDGTISDDKMDVYIKAFHTVMTRNDPQEDPSIRLKVQMLKLEDFLGDEAMMVDEVERSPVFVVSGFNAEIAAKHGKSWGVTWWGSLLSWADNQNNPDGRSIALTICEHTTDGLNSIRKLGSSWKLLHNLGWTDEVAKALIDGIIEGFGEILEEEGNGDDSVDVDEDGARPAEDAGVGSPST